ncbi:hypothetical protein [Hamadaea tsunoensis]|uniref:hypothetical protein n=1 Tax=Hamadaea tsunoensis TaxID=53368 RepID=UPI0004066D3C|nr:hypothetical protein [Hamadaea tsunoensis]
MPSLTPDAAGTVAQVTATLALGVVIEIRFLCDLARRQGQGTSDDDSTAIGFGLAAAALALEALAIVTYQALLVVAPELSQGTRFWLAVAFVLLVLVPGGQAWLALGDLPKVSPWVAAAGMLAMIIAAIVIMKTLNLTGS